MPATTQNLKLPYPLPTDPIADGANQIKALAESLDSKTLKLEILYVYVTGETSSNVSSYSFSGTAIAEGFTELLGAYCTATDVNASSSSFYEYAKTTNVTISNKTTVRVGGITSKRGYSETMKVLVWGY